MGNILLSSTLLFHLSNLPSLLWTLVDMLQTAKLLRLPQWVKLGSSGMVCSASCYFRYIPGNPCQWGVSCEGLTHRCAEKWHTSAEEYSCQQLWPGLAVSEGSRVRATGFWLHNKADIGGRRSAAAFCYCDPGRMDSELSESQFLNCSGEPVLTSTKQVPHSLVCLFANEIRFYIGP